MPSRSPFSPSESSFYDGSWQRPWPQPSYCPSQGSYRDEKGPNIERYDRRQHEKGSDLSDIYNQLGPAMPPEYPQAGTHGSNPQQPISRMGVPIHSRKRLPPLREDLKHRPPACYQQHAHAHQNAPTQQPAKEEKPVGGVSAKLDYDMEVMTDFVCRSAQSLVTPGGFTAPSFRKWVHQMLCATRLPSATILMSMFYLADRMSRLRSDVKHDIHRSLTIALVLGSKFLDDNTFINRSWSEVSGISVKELNMLEMEWLMDMCFKLHRDPDVQGGWITWSEHWQDFQSQARASARATIPNKLSPIKTTMLRHPVNLSVVNVNINVNQNKPLPPLPTIQTFNVNLPSIAPPAYHYASESAHPSSTGGASYGQYDQWRAANGDSPESAPTTGPTTPEYYGATNPWASAEGYSRRTMFGYPPCGYQGHMPPVFPGPHHSGYPGPPPYSEYNTPAWSPNRGAHDFSCGCMACGAHRSYMSYALLPQPIAG